MEKTLFAVSMILLLSVGLVSAHEGNFAEAKQLIDSGTSCDKLTDKHLEIIGEYYMEQMHPGEKHKLMDEMMGEEESESLKQMHIRMAKVLYCGESIRTSTNMINPVAIRQERQQYKAMMQDMIANRKYGFWYFNFINVFYGALVLSLIMLLLFSYYKNEHYHKR